MPQVGGQKYPAVTTPDAILAEVFTNEGTGTLIVEDIGKLAPAELAAGDASKS